MAISRVHPGAPGSSQFFTSFTHAASRAEELATAKRTRLCSSRTTFLHCWLTIAMADDRDADAALARDLARERVRAHASKRKRQQRKGTDRKKPQTVPE